MVFVCFTALVYGRHAPVTLPVTLNGQIHGERDEDYYRFTAKKDDVVVCDVLTARLGSRLDPIVELTDAAG